MLVQDGQHCAGGLGFCYHGVCQTYAEQCRALWGPGKSSVRCSVVSMSVCLSVCPCYHVVCQTYAMQCQALWGPGKSSVGCLSVCHNREPHVIYFASPAVAASSSTLWSRFSPPSHCVNGHMSIVVHGLSLTTIWRTFSIQKWEKKLTEKNRKIALCKEIGSGESNDSIRNFTASS